MANLRQRTDTDIRALDHDYLSPSIIKKEYISRILNLFATGQSVPVPGAVQVQT